MAYPEEEGADLGPEPSYSGGGFRPSLHLEGLIPLVLIVLIAAVAGAYLGFWDIPLISKKDPLQMLVIGTPSLQTRQVLDEAKDLVRWKPTAAEAFRVNPREKLAQYDVVMLNQVAEDNKCIPRQLGEALKEWVLKGGKLVTVMDSGICYSGSVEAIGWKAVLGDTVPVDCQAGKSGQPTCVEPKFIRGEIVREDFDHPIFEGIEVLPALQDAPPYELVVFDVAPVGNEIAYVQNVVTPEFYPAVVEKRGLGIGKSIYFNYDPGLTRVVLEKTLEYLR